MARLGYFKQAYTLWRSWYEQILFALFFLESPIHRLAWKVSELVSHKDSPQYRLMLHQLLNESNDGHPFSIIYSERYLKLLDAFKVSKPPPKDSRLIQKSTKVLTMLSQGVHGTYRPAPPRNEKELEKKIFDHCFPALNMACKSVLEFWLIYVVNLVNFDEISLVSLRSGILTEKNIEKYLLPETDDDDQNAFFVKEDIVLIHKINAPFKSAFENI